MFVGGDLLMGGGTLVWHLCKSVLVKAAIWEFGFIVPFGDIKFLW